MQTILVQTCTCSWWISRQHNGSLIPWSRIFIAACYSQMCFSSGHQDSSSPGWNWKTQVSWILRQIWAPNTRPILDTLPDFFFKKSWLDLACILKVLKYPCKVSPENVNSNQLAKPHGDPNGSCSFTPYHSHQHTAHTSCTWVIPHPSSFSKLGYPMYSYWLPDCLERNNLESQTKLDDHLGWNPSYQ